MEENKPKKPIRIRIDIDKHTHKVPHNKTEETNDKVEIKPNTEANNSKNN